MRLPWLAPFLVILACGGDDTVTSDTTGTSTNPGTSTGPVDPTTGSTGTPPGTSSTDPGTGDTSTGPGTTDLSSTGPATSDPGTTTTEGSSSGDETGPVLPGECVSDADCQLFQDCCECSGLPLGVEFPAPCKLLCDQPLCDQIGVDAAACRLGQCITERLDCDATKVACLALPPDCPEGQVPGVEGLCWSGTCVPGEICNVVPDCSFCPESWMCVTKVAFGPQGIVCEPIPADCMGDPSCDCAGAAVCTGDFSFCSDPGSNELNCECPNC